MKKERYFVKIVAMNIFKLVLDAIFPEGYTCELCGREIFDGSRLCIDCKDKVPFNDGATCPVCGRKTNTNALCLECKELAPLYDRAVSPLVYEDGVKRLILAFKGNKPYLKTWFAELMQGKCNDLMVVDGICFVPMTRSAESRRGYNQSYLLAKELSKLLKLPLYKKAIIKIKETPPQKSLTKREREQNLKVCFKADREIVAGKSLIVVDDVLTTGATANAVSGELKKRGALKVYFVTVASVAYNSKGEQSK